MEATAQNRLLDIVALDDTSTFESKMQAILSYGIDTSDEIVNLQSRNIYVIFFRIGAKAARWKMT